MAVNFGNNAVPGFLQVGYALPGFPVTGAGGGGGGTQVTFTYSGPLTALFPQYFDQGTGKPLLAAPGRSYTLYAINGDLFPAIPPNDDADWR